MKPAPVSLQRLYHGVPCSAATCCNTDIASNKGAHQFWSMYILAYLCVNICMYIVPCASLYILACLLVCPCILLYSPVSLCIYLHIIAYLCISIYMHDSYDMYNLALCICSNPRESLHILRYIIRVSLTMSFNTLYIYIYINEITRVLFHCSNGNGSSGQR